MFDEFFDFLDTFVTYLQHLSLSSIVNTYWFLIFIELPRYYIVEYAVMFHINLHQKRMQKLKKFARFRLYKDNPLISIIVPGKNEGQHIYKLVKSLAEQTYRNYEVIIIDDGSDDLTPYICADLEKAHLIDKYIRMDVRGGKASAANMGANVSKGKYIVHLDADSSLDIDAIENILLPFYLDDKVKGVGGCVKVRNSQKTICTSLQAIEYLKRIQVGRTVTSFFGIYHIISGAFGAFETKTLRTFGFWDVGPGLDGDITQKLRKAGYRVVFANDAICMTNVPTRWYKLFHQRIRWSRSLVRFRLRKHIDILLPNKNWSFLNWLSNMESIMYDCVLNFVWVFYVINLMWKFNEHIIEVVFLGYFIRLCFNFFGFGLIMITSERARQEFSLIRFMPLMSPYSGYFLRIVRSIAQLQEFFFFRSYDDPWNPEKTSRYAKLERK